ncbi:hypothetical protein LCGC14_3025710 [marine sediment metagenome]|uniref:DUF8033 domain-containing protein n=1 Tax=marine sediment metagenome TaxID=412755 RepID=A0A0F8WTT6_9ZZZZ
METNAQQESEKPKVKIKLENLGTPNKNKVVIETPKGSLVLFFSYQTIVSFNVNAEEENHTETINNLWSNTTGKLLNELCPDKSQRLEEAKFKELLEMAFNLVF